jgi:endonuclease/exonuclease/phosphatase family metal-dependent hydrolase
MSKHRGSRVAARRRLPGWQMLLALAPMVIAVALLATLMHPAAQDPAKVKTSGSAGSVAAAKADVAGAAVDGEVVAPHTSASAVPQLVAPPVTISPKPKKTRKAKPESIAVSSTSFQIGTLNVLGSNHAPRGTARAAREASLIRARGIDIIGLQEVQRDQRPVLARNLPGYQIWPQDALGRQGYRVQIAFRTDLFEKVADGGSTHTFDSQRVPIPWVRLRDRATGGEFFVIASHNSPRGMQAQRNASTAIQAALVNRLESTGLPVLMVGDFNEHTSFFCRIAARTGLVSANGARYAGRCVGPSGPVRIDWVLGTGGKAAFSAYRQDGTTRATGMSDHYLVYATVRLALPPRPSAPAAPTVPATGPAADTSGSATTSP